jgi:predicted kinase
VQVTAPDSLIRRRLASRSAGDIGGSEADVRVYERMRSRAEELRQPHHVVDTSQEIGPTMAIIAKELGAKERAS